MKNWKTFVAGLAVGFLNLLANGVTVKQAAVSVAIATLGACAKDGNVTGGTVPQSMEAERRTGVSQ